MLFAQKRLIHAYTFLTIKKNVRVLDEKKGSMLIMWAGGSGSLHFAKSPSV